MFQIKDDFYWTGIKDSFIRSFHRHELSTHRGTTYGSYFLKDEKNVLFDTVWDTHKEEFVESLEKEVGLANIHMIVINHCEPDHGGSLGYLMERIPNVPIYCTRNGADMIKKYHQKDWNFNVVKTGDRISTGKYDLMFIEMQMLHWPDSMATFIEQPGILVSNDAFGQHYAPEKYYYNDECDAREIYEEAIKYYANILTPYSALAKKKLEQLAGLNLKINMICPSHGIIWRDDPGQIVKAYGKWCDNYAEDTVTVVFGTIWESTEQMARAIARGIESQGAKVQVLDAALTDKNDLITEIFKSKAVLIGSPTINGSLVTSIGVVMDEMKALRIKGKPAAAYGSFGWSGESGKIISETLEKIGNTIVQPPIMLKYRPTPEELKACEQFGADFIKNISGQK